MEDASANAPENTSSIPYSDEYVLLGIATIKKMIAGLNETIRLELNTKLDNLTTIIENLRLANDRLGTQIDLNFQWRNTCDKDMKELETDNAIQLKWIEYYDKEINTLEDKEKSDEEMITWLEENNAFIQDQNDTLVTKMEEMVAINAELFEKINNTETDLSQKNALLLQLQQTQEEIKELAKETKELAKKTKKMKKKRPTLTKHLRRRYTLLHNKKQTRDMMVRGKGVAAVKSTSGELPELHITF